MPLSALRGTLRLNLSLQSLFVCLLSLTSLCLYDLSTHTAYLIDTLQVLLCSSFSAHPRGVSFLQVHLETAGIIAAAAASRSFGLSF